MDDVTHWARTDGLAIVLLALGSALVAMMILNRLGIQLSTLVAPATVAGVALGSGAQRVCGRLLLQVVQHRLRS